MNKETTSGVIGFFGMLIIISLVGIHIDLPWWLILSPILIPLIIILIIIIICLIWVT